MQEKGFFGALFDIDFSSFVTTKIVKVLYVIALVLSALVTIFYIVTAFAANSGAGVVVLILSPILYLLFVLYSRVTLEFVIVVFRIYENTRGLSSLAPPSGAGPIVVPGASTPPQPPAPGPGGQPPAPGPETP